MAISAYPLTNTADISVVPIAFGMRNSGNRYLRQGCGHDHSVGRTKPLRRESDSAKTLLGSCFVRDRCRARRPMSGDTAVSNEMSSPVLRSKLRRTPLSSHPPRASTPAPTTAGTPRLRRLDHGRRDRGDQRCSTRPFRDSAGEAGRAAAIGQYAVAAEFDRVLVRRPWLWSFAGQPRPRWPPMSAAC